MQDNLNPQPSSSPQPPSPVQPPVAPVDEKQARTWNMLCHLSALAGFIVPPVGHILGPLLVWQIKKNEFPSVDIHGKAAVNFQLSATIVLFGLGIVAGIGSFFCFGHLLIPVVMAGGVAAIVFSVIAGIKANDGKDYKYPWSLNLLK